MSVPATTGMRIAKPIIELLDMTPPMIKDHFTGLLAGIGAVGAVWANWNSAAGWRGFARNASLGAGFGYGVARLLRDGVDSFRPLPNHEAQSNILADVANVCISLEVLSGITYDSSYAPLTLPQRLELVRKGIIGRNHELGTLQHVQKAVKNSLNSDGTGTGTTIFAQAEQIVEEERLAHIAAAKAAKLGVAQGGTPPQQQVQQKVEFTLEQKQCFQQLNSQQKQWLLKQPPQQQQLILQNMVAQPQPQPQPQFQQQQQQFQQQQFQQQQFQQPQPPQFQQPQYPQQQPPQQQPPQQPQQPPQPPQQPQQPPQPPQPPQPAAVVPATAHGTGSIATKIRSNGAAMADLIDHRSQGQSF